jgi:hypothetical protein
MGRLARPHEPGEQVLPARRRPTNSEWERAGKMAHSRDAVFDIHLSDQWRVHGGPRRETDRAELRDRLIPLVTKAFGSVESSLDLLLKESPCATGNGIRTLIRAYQLLSLRLAREALEAQGREREQHFASFASLFEELDQSENRTTAEAEKVRALLRTSVCRLPLSAERIELLSNDRSEPPRPVGAPRPSASQRTLTKEQQDRISAAENELNDSIAAYEKMRELLGSDEWRQQSQPSNGPTMLGELVRLNADVKKYAINVFTVLAQASWYLGSAEPFRERLETDIRDIVAHVCAKASQNDFVDHGALETALNRAMSGWIVKAEREFQPPWLARAPVGPPRTEQREDSAAGQTIDAIETTGPDPFQEDASERPLGDNPFPPDHPANGVFEEANWEAKEAINRLKSELLQAVPNPHTDLIQSLLTFRVRVFSACANAALRIVGNEETAVGYERWIDDYADFMLKDTLLKGQRPDPHADPGTPPLFRPELLRQIEADLTFQLMRAVAHYKERASARVLEVLRIWQEQATAATAPSDTQEMVAETNTGEMPNPEAAVRETPHYQIADEAPPSVVVAAEGEIAAADGRSLSVASEPHPMAVPEALVIQAEAAVPTSDKGNLDILRGTDGEFKRAVTLDVARRFGGVTRRAIEDAAQRGTLTTEGNRLRRRVLVDSLLKYFPPEK